MVGGVQLLLPGLDFDCDESMFDPAVPLTVRAAPITPDNKSTAVTIAAYLLMSIFVVTVLSRVAIKWLLLRRFQADDAFILLATVCLARSTK